MGNIRISQLPAAGQAFNDHRIPVEAPGGATQYITVEELKDAMPPGGVSQEYVDEADQELQNQLNDLDQDVADHGQMLDGIQNTLTSKADLVAGKVPAAQLTNVLNDTGSSVNQTFSSTKILTLVQGLLDLRGSYNASSNAFPATGGSGDAGAVVKGDCWFISVAGTLNGVEVSNGDMIYAVVDSPTSAGWGIVARPDLDPILAQLADHATRLAALELLVDEFIPNSTAARDYPGWMPGKTYAINLTDYPSLDDPYAGWVFVFKIPLMTVPDAGPSGWGPLDKLYGSMYRWCARMNNNEGTMIKEHATLILNGAGTPHKVKFLPNPHDLETVWDGPDNFPQTAATFPDGYAIIPGKGYIYQGFHDQQLVIVQGEPNMVDLGDPSTWIWPRYCRAYYLDGKPHDNYPAEGVWDFQLNDYFGPASPGDTVWRLGVTPLDVTAYLDGSGHPKLIADTQQLPIHYVEKGGVLRFEMTGTLVPPDPISNGGNPVVCFQISTDAADTGTPYDGDMELPGFIPSGGEGFAWFWQMTIELRLSPDGMSADVFAMVTGHYSWGGNGINRQPFYAEERVVNVNAMFDGATWLRFQVYLRGYPLNGLVMPTAKLLSGRLYVI